MEVATPAYTLGLDDATGALLSLRSARAPDHELIAPTDGSRPLFTIHYLDEQRRFRLASSGQAARCEIGRSEHEGETRLHLRYDGIGDLGAAAHVTIRCPHGDGLSYWSLTLEHRSPAVVANVQFPIVIVPYRYEGYGPTNLIVPFNLGALYRNPRPEQFEPDYPDVWQFVADVAHFTHYPGATFAQFLAHYDERQGIYVGCHDPHGHIKMVKPVHNDEGLRLGLAHVVGWSEPGERSLGYEVAIGPFSGDWYDAADIYRDWHLSARGPEPKLCERDDVPRWLLGSPLHVVMRIQGEVDAGPARPNREFQPYERALPALDRLSEAVDAPLVPVIMAWERPGPWVYPDSFPVAGGDDSLRAFTSAARARGWHVGTYCNGTSWAVGHKWTGYDGREFFEREGGEDSVCRLPDGAAWRQGWDGGWRPSFPCCVGAGRTRDLAAGYVEHLVDLGLDWIQFLDQNCGAAAFPCYSDAHGHPSAPGEWMTDSMEQLLARLEGIAERSGRDVVFSSEMPPNDHFRGHFAICDIRPHPVDSTDVPLYKYLYHEYILTQAAFSLAPNPYWMQIKTANSFVMGDILAAIMGPGGRLMNWEGYPWAPWSSPEGDQPAVLTLLRRAIALRRGKGRDYLVFGRLLRPYPVVGIERVEWLCDRRLVSYPAVVHALWRAPDGRVGLALANWTGSERAVHLEDCARFEGPATYCLNTDEPVAADLRESGHIALVLPPLSVGLLEWTGSRRAGDIAS